MNKLELIGKLTLNYINSVDATTTYRMNLWELYEPYISKQITEKEFNEICKIDRKLCGVFQNNETSRKHRVL